MSMELAKNPLEITDGVCTIEKISAGATDATVAGWAKEYFADGASVVVWRMHKVEWGTVEGGVIRFGERESLDTETILELRIFNETAELHAVRCKDQFAGRYVEDRGTQKVKFVDSFARFWGEKFGRNGKYVVLKDRMRKLSMTVPCAEEALYYGLVTRNYIGYAPQNGQAGYVDYRYVKIASAEGGE